MSSSTEKRTPEKLIELSKEYTITKISGKNRNDIYDITKNLFYEIMFPVSGTRSTPEELMNIPISSRDIFDEDVYTTVFNVSNVFELLRFCVLSSKNSLFDLLGIPGILGKEPTLGYRNYMSTTLLDKIGEMNYEDSITLLTEESVKLSVVIFVDRFLDGKLLDKIDFDILHEFKSVIREVRLAQAFRVVSKNEARVASAVYSTI